MYTTSRGLPHRGTGRPVFASPVETISGSYNANAAFSASVLLAYLAGFMLLSTFCGRKAIKADVQQSVATLKEHMASA